MYRQLGHLVVATPRSIAPSSDDGVVTVPGDIVEPATSVRAVERVLRDFRNIGILVNKCRRVPFLSKPFTQYTEDEFELVTGVNVRGFFTLTQGVLAGMLERCRGHIVTITTSILDQALSVVPSALTASDVGGLNAVTKSMVLEFASSGVRVNAVSPGIIKASMHPASAHDALAAAPAQMRSGILRRRTLSLARCCTSMAAKRRTLKGRADQKAWREEVDE
jgi:NAD(P)-dependent dehydrogenase (short-subunit alcohol dehydrogenase family)